MDNFLTKEIWPIVGNDIGKHNYQIQPPSIEAMSINFHCFTFNYSNEEEFNRKSISIPLGFQQLNLSITLY